MIDIKNFIEGIIVILLVFSGVAIQWQVDKNWTTLLRDGTIIAKERWVVEAERSSFLLDSWYDRNIKCPKVIEHLGGHISSTGKSCIYPNNHFEQLSRSLINTQIDLLDSFTVKKSSPQYKYGTRGAYAGFLTETFTFENETQLEENFPKEYTINWNPRDTRNYRLIWRVESLKNVDLGTEILISDIPCTYSFGNVKIDMKDACSELSKVVFNKNKAWFYFNPQRDSQFFDINFVDPTDISLPTEITKNILIYSGVFEVRKCDLEYSEELTTQEYVDIINFTYIYIDNTTFINETRTEFRRNATKLLVIGKKIISKEVNCKTIGLTTPTLKISCPERFKCNVEGTQWCYLNLDDGDENFNFSNADGRGWDGGCTPIPNLKEESIKISSYRNIFMDVKRK